MLNASDSSRVSICSKIDSHWVQPANFCITRQSDYSVTETSLAVVMGALNWGINTLDHIQWYKNTRRDMYGIAL